MTTAASKSGQGGHEAVYRVRSATQADVQFLREMVRQAAIEPGAVEPRLEDVLQDERLARYIVDWRRPGDGGVIAEVDGHPVGAAWYRRFSRKEPGYGFVDEGIPELSIGIVPEMRGRGIGRALLVRLIGQARAESLPALSLSVSVHNQVAMHLYESLGFRTVAGDAGHPTMLITV
jgi:ribosomal protein S18 acetylase RimI-like enzyme